MRILHLLASPVFSGPAENVALLALAQRTLGHEVTVAVDRKRAGHTSEEPSVPRLRELGLLDEGGLELSVKSLPWALARDAWRLRRRAVDVIHSHFSHDHFLARSLRARSITLVRSVHAPRSLRGLPIADGYTAPRSDDLAQLPRDAPSMVLPALVGPEFVPSADRAALQRQLSLEGAPVIGMVSTFQASRNHLVALEAFARLHRESSGARLVLVGDGELEPVLRERVNALDLRAAVTFAGYRTGRDFVGWLQALDEVWILGLGNDWSGRAAAQARACGARVVAIDQGALAEHADALVAAGDSSPEAILHASEASRTARARSATSRDPLAIAREILELYERAGSRR